MRCMYCQGRMERGTAPFHIDRKGYHLLFDRIPAWVCSQCGEVYLKRLRWTLSKQLFEQWTSRLKSWLYLRKKDNSIALHEA